MLIAPDEQSCLVVSYKEIKSCVEAAFRYVLLRHVVYLTDLGLQRTRQGWKQRLQSVIPDGFVEHYWNKIGRIRKKTRKITKKKCLPRFTWRERETVFRSMAFIG